MPTARASMRSTLSGCGREEGVRDLAPDSFTAAAKPAQPTPTEGAVSTNTGEREVTVSTGITMSGDGAPRCGGVDEGVDAVDGDALITPRDADAGRDFPAASSRGCRGIRVSCACALEDRRKIASLKQEKREAEVEVCGKPLLVSGDCISSSIC